MGTDVVELVRLEAFVDGIFSLHSWNPVFSARLVENGTALPSTSLPDAGRAMWKIARCAVSPMCCVSSTDASSQEFFIAAELE